MNYTQGSVISWLETGLLSGQLLYSHSKLPQNVPICLRCMKRQESLAMRLCQMRTFFEKSCLLYQHFTVSQVLRLGASAQIYLQQMLRFSIQAVGDSIFTLLKANVAEKIINLQG
ncbi:hypothetical protein F7734_29710 [Scytonema sp. UIC 10036]|uniref:hypothetical protein n=1 Tax=Scytonema sp. UIC 10036 TaxID=2304196 RepID=UPI0012DAE54B|nr:hypothetical protein [Scytonema sp. UIC 10036]MUG96290.1 hypothetical protein [Scytonema sp. UIC 10036]